MSCHSLDSATHKGIVVNKDQAAIMEELAVTVLLDWRGWVLLEAYFFLVFNVLAERSQNLCSDLENSQLLACSGYHPC